MAKHVVVSLSGGMDSSTLLLRAIEKYDSVTAISFDYGQKHRVELERAQSLVDYLNTNPMRVYPHDHGENGFSERYSKIKYQVIKLDGLVDLLDSALVQGGDDVPEGHYEQDNMKETVVPNRNKMFASITQAVALSIANKTEETCDIALGIHAGDHAVYPDCRQEFRDADDAAFRIGNWEADRVGYFTPYLNTDKFGILKDGEVLCEKLGIDFLTELYNWPVWKQTSYNSDGGSHKLGGTAFRKNHAGIGGRYDSDRDAFVAKKPYPSWILNETTCQWEAPIALPDTENKYN